MKAFYTLIILFFAKQTLAQSIDSTKTLQEIVVKGYYNKQPLLRSVSAVTVLDSNQIKNQSDISLVNILNTSPGVKMEERSPGSYRLSLRGSLLRSPFGIRNIKIYIDDFPLTDAGGNTYLNLLDAKAVNSIEIYKGPEASSFGANTGGTILINLTEGKNNLLSGSLSAGSYDLFHQTAQLEQVRKQYRFNLFQGYQRSDGYRENSALHRKYFQTSHQWNYNTNGLLKALFFFSDLDYQTPGGLTEQQLLLNPKMARPATATLPGAVQQKAAIYNQTIFVGLSHNYNFNQHFKHVVAVFASHTNFKNPFITNYEKRKENTLGLRSFLEIAQYNQNFNYVIQGGIESARTKSDINNFNNNGGSATNLQAADDLSANQTFAFLRLNFDINKRLLIEVGSSLNFFNYKYESYFPVAVTEQKRSFKNQLMPKMSASYLATPSFTFRGSVSRGYSPPTLAEVRSSDNVINNNLQAEVGWNYELGARFKSENNLFYADLSAFNFQLNDAIVRRLNANDVEYFVNAGSTKQKGAELQLSWLIIQNRNQFLTDLRFRNSYTLNNFHFRDFISGAQNFSGNRLTGVPNHIIVNSLEFTFNKDLYFFAQYNYTSNTPLNDANTAYAKGYHLVDLKTGINNVNILKSKFNFSFGVNNLLNKNYSLGNDLNAANNRYFNAAAGINFYTGLSVKIN